MLTKTPVTIQESSKVSLLFNMLNYEQKNKSLYFVNEF